MRASGAVLQEQADLERFCKAVQAVPGVNSFLENYAFIAAAYGRWMLGAGPAPSVLLQDMLNYALRGDRTLTAWSSTDEPTLDDDLGEIGGSDGS